MRIPANITTVLNLRFYSMLGVLYVDGQNTNLNTTSFNSYNASTFNTILIPANQTIKDLLISRGFSERNIYFNPVYQQSNYVEQQRYNLSFKEVQQDGTDQIYSYRPNVNPLFAAAETNWNIVKSAQLVNSDMLIKYSEYPVMFIVQLFVNGLHVETLLSKDQFFEKLNKK